MRKLFDYSRRAVLGAGGALAFLAALRPLRIFAQASGGKLGIGIIGSGHIGGAIGGLWVKAGHPVLFSSRHPEELKDFLEGEDWGWLGSDHSPRMVTVSQAKTSTFHGDFPAMEAVIAREQPDFVQID